MEWNTNNSLCGYDQERKTSSLWIFYTLLHYHDYAFVYLPICLLVSICYFLYDSVNSYMYMLHFSICTF